MTQDDVIRLAREADLDWHTGWTLDDEAPNRFEAFAKLVAEHEREACAKVCEEFSNTPANMSQAWRNGCRESATEIRERGQA